MMVVAAALAALMSVVPRPAAADVGEQFPVVVVGDSIVQLVPPFLWPDGWLVDAQGARQPFAAPLVTYDGSVPTSTRDAIAADIPLVAAGGVLILQDVVGPLAPWGMTLEDWAGMIAETVDLLPDDRCLVVVTGYWPDEFGVNGVDQVEQNLVLVELVAGQPCHRVVGWADAVVDDRGRLDPDGVHPSIAGSLWLTSALSLTVTDVTS